MDRRIFLAAAGASSLTLGAAQANATTLTTPAAEGIKPPLLNLVYTADNLGVHQARKGTHLPKIEAQGGKVTVTTPHGSSDEHFIVRHTLLLADGTLVGAKVFTSKDKPVSEYTLPAGYTGKVYATSFCNLHDLWLSETSV